MSTDKRIPLCVPQIQGNEWKYVKDCLDSGWVSSVGSYVDQFECQMARRLKVGHGIATASGTAALHVAMLVAGVRPGDEVLVSDLTFIAPANAIRYAGAFPVFIDVEPDYWQMDPQRVSHFLEKCCLWRDGALFNRITGRRVAAVVPVHILGHPVSIRPILEIARRYGLAVIEDATESLGAQYNEQPVGGLADIACLSFNGNKLITTGGGGMILTNNDSWAERARYLTTQAKDDSVEYIHNEIGYNYRLTNIQAAVGVAQLELVDCYVAAKRRIAEIYANAYQSLPGIHPMSEAYWARSVFWMYTICVSQLQFGFDSRALMHSLANAGIQSRPLWQPLHLSPAHVGAQAIGGEVAEKLWCNALSLPCSVGLTTGEQERVTQHVAACYTSPPAVAARGVIEFSSRPQKTSSVLESISQSMSAEC